LAHAMGQGPPAVFQVKIAACVCNFIAPTEVQFEFLKSSFFVVAVFLWPNRVIIGINMHQEATRPPTWSLGGGIKVEKKKL
jgi:hypothetical protein